MKLFKKALILFCVAAILVGGAIGMIVWPTELPPEREVLHEEMPEANPLRVAHAVDGVGGSRFYICSPNVDAMNVVSVSAFGASIESADDTETINKALEYCKDHPGTRLVFDKSFYYVSGRLNMTGLKDVCVDGNGAKILYCCDDRPVDIEGCECLEVRDLSFDWDWDKIPLGALARAVEVKGEKNTLDFVFDVPAYAREDMFYAITQCDEETGTYGAKGTLIEYYAEEPGTILTVKKIGSDTVRITHNGALARFAGNKFILRSTAYGGSLCHIDKSRDITLDRLNLYGGTGMGIVIGERSSHFALRNIFIGPDPAHPEHCTSLDADAVHINDADGCFIIENCDFSKQGDDDVNINCGIGMIESVNGKEVVFAADGSMDSEPGDTMQFRDKKFRLLKQKSVVVSCERMKGKLRKVVFRDELPAELKKGGFLFNADCTGANYVIRNNYFHEHRARGLLLQTSDGLVENNTFYKTSHDAIRIVMDINGVWHEGTGADNILIRNNKFIECGVIGTEIIEIGTHVMSKSGGSYAFTNIRMENNEFSDICGNLMAVNNVNNFVFSGNKITLGNVFRPDVGQGRAYFLKDCANVDFSGNEYTDAKRLFTKIIRSDSPLVWARVNISALRKKGGAR